MTDRSGILPNSPLVYTLASIRFAAWPLLAKKIDEIHDELRDCTPLIQTIQVQSVSHGGISGMQSESVTTLWMLLSSDRSLGIHLAPDQLLIFSKKYTSYIDFEAVLDRCLSILLKHMRFIDVISTGVRYVDHIKIKDGEEHANYITDRLLTPTFPGFTDVGCIYVGSYKSGDYDLRVRCTSQPDALAVPEDIISTLSMSLEPGSPLKLDTLKNGILLDIDAYKVYTTPTRMDKDVVLKQLDVLHQTANKFFRHDSVCTDYAFKTWKGEF
ncbi:TIGR04255 family protein [Methylobacter sp. BlB1]|uniref:TIGR04255 family protein n=1 Tax=Methylobacter sp. BlB1 TaxID=2785914 RepID=UPI0018958E65|nr:TIGR04255 family protein [Methylobacter sp. BlB1]MBF6647173.1 TIGR04255 family protein [Methylobacter sp. BlB1]